MLHFETHPPKNLQYSDKSYMPQKRFQSSLLAIFLCAASGLVGCTAAVPNVSSLTTLSSFSSKSSGPFTEHHPGGIVKISGECLPVVTGFEMRLNEHALWTPIPTTPPAPDTTEGEYLAGTPEYDVDCSDGTFNFYLFKTGAFSNFTLNSITPLDSDPYRIEFRALTNLPIDLPTIVFNRPPAVSVKILRDWYEFNSFNEMETNRSARFRIAIQDVYGEHTHPARGTTLAITPTLINLTSTAMPAGAILDGECDAVASGDDLEFDDETNELTLCYMADGVAAGTNIRLEISAPGLASATQSIKIYNANSVKPQLTPYTPNDPLPPVLVRGLTYKFKSNVSPLYYSSSGYRNVSSWSGTFAFNASSELIRLGRVGSDTECPAMQANSMSCNTAYQTKDFVLEVDTNYAKSSMDLKISNAPITSCGSGCQIYDSIANAHYNITDYVANVFYFPVVSGGGTYAAPYFKPHDSMIRFNECVAINLGGANAEGHPIPMSAASQYMTVSTVGLIGEFYNDHGCTMTGLSSTTKMLYSGDILKTLYFKASNPGKFPANGIITFTIDDGNATVQKEFYMEAD